MATALSVDIRERFLAAVAARSGIFKSFMRRPQLNQEQSKYERSYRIGNRDRARPKILQLQDFCHLHPAKGEPQVVVVGYRRPETEN